MIRQREEVELQKRITLDEALLAGVETYRNGCSYRLYIKKDGTYWLGFGCYLLVNLVQGEKYLLLKWLGGADACAPLRQLDGLVRPETLVELLSRAPCSRCGGPRFEPRENIL